MKYVAICLHRGIFRDTIGGLRREFEFVAQLANNALVDRVYIVCKGYWKKNSTCEKARTVLIEYGVPAKKIIMPPSAKKMVIAWHLEHTRLDIIKVADLKEHADVLTRAIEKYFKVQEEQEDSEKTEERPVRITEAYLKEDANLYQMFTDFLLSRC